MTKKELDGLKRVRRLLEMDANAFRFSTNEIVTLADGTKVDSSDFVREATSKWRQTWILPVLDRIIAKHDGPA